MSVPLTTFLNGYYNENGFWHRTKFCFRACTHCDCGPPGGFQYDARYDKHIKEDYQEDQFDLFSDLIDQHPIGRPMATKVHQDWPADWDGRDQEAFWKALGKGCKDG